jgi:hypothetical protein
VAFSRVLAIAWLWPQTEAHHLPFDESQQAPDTSLGDSIAGERMAWRPSRRGLA